MMTTPHPDPQAFLPSSSFGILSSGCYSSSVSELPTRVLVSAKYKRHTDVQHQNDRVNNKKPKTQRHQSPGQAPRAPLFAQSSAPLRACSTPEIAAGSLNNTVPATDVEPFRSKNSSNKKNPKNNTEVLPVSEPVNASIGPHQNSTIASPVNPAAPFLESNVFGVSGEGLLTSQGNNSDVVVPGSAPTMWAISYHQLLNFHRVASDFFGTQSYQNQTMRDIVEKILVDHCNKAGTCYALSKNPKGLRANVFVTHAWDEPFADFVESIIVAFHTDVAKPNLWICAFALKQGSKTDIADLINQPALHESPFVQALRATDTLLVVRNPTADLYSRIWCICELIYAKQFGMFPHKVRVAGPEDFSHLRTSCLDAKAFCAHDKERILDVLLRNHAVEKIDSLVRDLRTFPSHSNTLSRKPRSNEPVASWYVRRAWIVFMFAAIVPFLLFSAGYFLQNNSMQLRSSVEPQGKFDGKPKAVSTYTPRPTPRPTPGPTPVTPPPLPGQSRHVPILQETQNLARGRSTTCGCDIHG